MASPESRSVKRAVRDLLRDVAAGEVGPAVAARAKELLGPRRKPGPKKPRPASVAFAAARRRQEDDAELEAVLAMHSAVWALNRILTADRAAPAGRCDCGCLIAFRHADEGELDHWIERSQGGEHTAANGWRLSKEHHWDKTANRPSRADWNQRREEYCRKAGVPFVPRRERAS